MKRKDTVRDIIGFCSRERISVNEKWIGLSDVVRVRGLNEVVKAVGREFEGVVNWLCCSYS